MQRCRLVLAIALVAVSSLAGCGRDHSAHTWICTGRSDGTHYSITRWTGGEDDGIAVMFLDQITAGSRTSEGTVMDANGIGYQWRLLPGLPTARKIQVNGQDYDLSNGSVFAIKVTGRSVSISQCKWDLADLQDTRKSCEAYVGKQSRSIRQQFTDSTDAA